MTWPQIALGVIVVVVGAGYVYIALRNSSDDDPSDGGLPW